MDSEVDLDIGYHEGKLGMILHFHQVIVEEMDG